MENDPGSSGTFFRDMLMLALMGFLAMVIMMLPHLNPPKQRDSSQPPGNLIAYITWKPGNIDVDMWLTGPGEPKPVGYSRKNGVIWDLLRDDVGTSDDKTGLNFENAYTRGLVPGEYVINVHCYRCREHVPVRVVLELSVKKPGSDVIKKIYVGTITLHEENQELTMVRFILKADGSIRPGSVDTVFLGKMRSSDSPGTGRSGPGSYYP